MYIRNYWISCFEYELQWWWIRQVWWKCRVYSMPQAAPQWVVVYVTMVDANSTKRTVHTCFGCWWSLVFLLSAESGSTWCNGWQKPSSSGCQKGTMIFILFCCWWEVYFWFVGIISIFWLFTIARKVVLKFLGPEE